VLYGNILSLTAIKFNKDAKVASIARYYWRKRRKKKPAKDAVSFEHVYSSKAASTLTAASFGNSLQKSFSLTRPGWVTASVILWSPQNSWWKHAHEKANSELQSDDLTELSPTDINITLQHYLCLILQCEGSPGSYSHLHTCRCQLGIYECTCCFVFKCVLIHFLH